AAPSPDEMAFQVLGEFGHLHLTAAQFAQLATVQQAWIGMRRDLAASMARHERRHKGDVADLSLIDRARDSEVRRIVGEETFRIWLATRDVHHRAFQSDPQVQGLDERRIAQIYAAIREHDLATTTLPSAGPSRAFSDQSADRHVPSDTRALQVAETEVVLGNLLGRAPFARMQRQGLFGLPDLTLPPHDSSLPAPAHPTPSYLPGSQNP
ncbi:MAG: hypothetical protein QG602_3846, partial [Verrucomicrobiota bacterium]|nr:hypothetical protein [Verrucomicrobiota bacterium]